MQINDKNLCENCFRELTSASCDYCAKKIKFVASALPQGTVLFERYMIGKPIEETDGVIKYYAYDMNLDKRTLINEYFPSVFASRAADQSTVIALDEERYNDGLERFFDEAKALSDFKKCKGIIKIYKFFNQNGTSYYVTELLDGYDLDKYLKKLSRKIPETAAVKIILKTIDALEDIHKAGACHGKLSPSNIFLCSNGQVKLSTAGGETAEPEKSALKYAPIERKIRNYGRASVATDIYSLGAIMLQMITGSIPKDPIARLEGAELDLSGVSDQLRPVLGKMLEVLPSDRYKSLGELKEALSSRLTIRSHAEETVSVEKDDKADLSSVNVAAKNASDKLDDSAEQGHVKDENAHIAYNESSNGAEDSYAQEEALSDSYEDDEPYDDQYDDLQDDLEYYDENAEMPSRSGNDTRLLLAILYSLLGALAIFLIMVIVLLFA